MGIIGLIIVCSISYYILSEISYKKELSKRRVVCKRSFSDGYNGLEVPNSSSNLFVLLGVLSKNKADYNKLAMAVLELVYIRNGKNFLNEDSNIRMNLLLTYTNKLRSKDLYNIDSDGQFDYLFDLVFKS